jgi:hypothetical protein
LRLDDGDREDTFAKIYSFDEYQSLIAGETSSDYDEPEAYIIWNDFLYVYPTPKLAYTLRIFAKIYEQNVDAINMPDDLEEAIISYVCYEVLKNKGLGGSDEAKGHLQNALNLINVFNKLETYKIPPTNIKYNDI